MEAVRQHFSSTIESTAIVELLQAAHCVTCATEKPGDAHFDIAVSLLDSVIVPSGLGEAAVKLFQRNFQEQAVAGEGSDISHWIAWLSESGYSPKIDPNGSPGQKVAAEVLALADYREQWAKRENKLHYSLLAQDLPAIKVPRLARTFQVSIASGDGEAEKKKSLLAVARRWDRFILAGLPGAGKSTAIRQVAANWAARADAPTPLVVPLKEVSQRISESAQVTLRLLLDVATYDFEPRLRDSLLTALEEQAQAGHVALFLDGLDECRQLAGMVSTGIVEVLREIDPDIPVIVTGRDNSLPAARMLGFKEVRLVEPNLLDRTMHKILEAAAEARIPENARESWLEVKRQIIEEAKDENHDIWQVPLLATLLTLLAASTEIEAFPQSRAQILLEVVRDSVRKWEVSRLTIDPPGSWNESLKAAHLLDGFATIGHAINETAAVGANQVDDAVMLMLQSRWNCPSGEAENLAPQIRWFWDERVGVFLTSDHGRKMEARSRQFVEIADAVWVTHQNDADITSWLSSAINETSMEETVSLASGLSLKVSTLLLRAALDADDPQVQARGLLWLLKAEVNDQTLSPEMLERLIQATCDQYQKIDGSGIPPAVQNGSRILSSAKQIMSNIDARQRKVDGFGWAHLAYLARVKMPDGVRSFRDRAFASLQLSGLRKHIVRSLAALTDADADHRELSRAEIAAVAEFLQTDVELPDRKPPTQVSRRRVIVHASDPLLTGHAEAVMLTIRHLEHFSDDVLEHLRVVAQRGPAQNFPVLADALGARGIVITSGLQRAVRELASIFGNEDGWSRILEAIAAMPIGDESPIMARKEKWKISTLVGLMEALGLAEVGVGEYRAATEDDSDLLPHYMRSFASACGFDLGYCASQARFVLDSDEDERREDYDLLLTALGESDPNFVRAGLHDIETLVAGLSYESDWIADLSCWVLANLKDERAISYLAERRSSLRPRRKKLATIASCLISTAPISACEGALADSDPAVRAGGAHVLRMVESGGDRIKAAYATVIADDDMTIRWAVSEDKHLSVGGSYWSCPECSGRNNPDDLNCANCSTGERPFD